jgi:hypothetical protein
MAIEVETKLAPALEAVQELLSENLKAVRAGSAIALAQSLGLDITDPSSRLKVSRYLVSVEASFAGDGNE